MSTRYSFLCQNSPTQQLHDLFATAKLLVLTKGKNDLFSYNYRSSFLFYSVLYLKQTPKSHGKKQTLVKGVVAMY